MSRNKRYLVLALNTALLAGMSSFVPAALAQDQQPPAAGADVQTEKRQPPTPEKVVDRMASKLNLTADQKQQLLPIITERQQKMQALRNDTSMRRGQKRRAMKQIFQDSDQKITAILNPDQQKQYTDMKQEMRQHMKERRHHHQG